MYFMVGRSSNFFLVFLGSKYTFQITKIPTELNFCGDLGHTIGNKVSEVPIEPMCAKKLFGITGHINSLFAFFSKTVRFIKKIAETKVSCNCL